MSFKNIDNISFDDVEPHQGKALWTQSQWSKPRYLVWNINHKIFFNPIKNLLNGVTLSKS